MPDLLTDVRRILADLSSDELEVLLATPQLCPPPSTGLLAWVEHAADWELNRRKRFDFRLAAPEEAIDPTEDTAAIGAATALQEGFANEPDIARFFAAIADILIGRGQRH